MKNLFFLATAFFLAFGANAQKKALTLEDFNGWNNLRGRAITDDGTYALWTKTPQEGDVTLMVYNTVTGEKLTFDRAERPLLTNGNKFLIYQLAIPYEEERELKRKETKRKDMPKPKLIIYNMAAGTADTIADVVSFSLPREEGNWLQLTFDEAPKKEAAKDESKSEKKKKEKKKKKKKSKKGEAEEAPAKKKKAEKPTGKFVQLINLDDQSDKIDIKFVDDIFVPEYATQVYFLRNIGDSVDYKGLFALDLASKNKTLIDSNFKAVSGVSLNKRGTKVAFSTTLDSAKADIRFYNLKLWDGEKAVSLLDTATAGMPENWMPSADFAPIIDENGKYIVVGTKPIPTIYPKDTLALKSEKVSLDIWHWEDEQIQPMQNLNVKRDAKKAYAGRIDLANNSFLQLGNDEWEVSRIPSDTLETYLTVDNDKAYRKELSWLAPTHRKGAIIEIATGKRIDVADSLRAGMGFSTNQKYVYWFDRKARHWMAFDIATQKTINLSKSIPFPVWDESHDSPDEPYNYSAVGWIDDEYFVFTDKYDIWAVNPKSPTKPKNLTKGTGRKAKKEYSFIHLKLENKNLNHTIWTLQTTDEATKNEGFVQLNWKTGEFMQLVEPTNHSFGYPIKAKHADKIVFTKGNFVEYPEIYVADTQFQNAKKLSDANPQQKDFNWGTVEMVEWDAYNGKKMKGLMYKPENFDPNKKYPMLVYFYETYTDRVHRYYTPAPSASVINFSYYASNEYVIFVPDIVYTTGQPGQDAYDCIVSGAKAMAKNSWVDSENMAIQGQSWGGYQVAYLVTKTNMFKCGMAGAPVSNMTSAYGGIRWGSGMSREFQYEKTQSRLGATLWEDREAYIKNSPVFFADKVETPLLMMHNDQDGAVPWYQGIEYFMALRRLNKPVWMLVYNGEDHNLMKRHNRKDLSQRMSQFFDYYLKEGPSPEWIINGRKAIEKDDNPGFDIIQD